MKPSGSMMVVFSIAVGPTALDRHPQHPSSNSQHDLNEYRPQAPRWVAVDRGHMLGSTIFHYRVLEKLGGNGTGVVYEAEDLKRDFDHAEAAQAGTILPQRVHEASGS